MNTDDVQYLDWQWVEEHPESALDLMLKLHSENVALRADAERYRYIKNSETMEVSEILQSFCVSITFDLDAAIDSARKEGQP